MSADKFDWSESDIASGGVRLFTSVEACDQANKEDTIKVAHAAGFDAMSNTSAHSTICGKPGTAELIEVEYNGHWEYRESSEEPPKVYNGINSVTLKWCLDSSPKRREQLFGDNKT